MCANWARVRGRFSFIVTMAEPRYSNVMRAIDSGADAILCKPFSATSFWKRVDHSMNARLDSGEATLPGSDSVAASAA